MTLKAPTGNLKYAGRHKALRKRLMADLERRPGQPCGRCGRPMYTWQRLHLDHTDDALAWRGLAHAICNLRAAQRKTAAINRLRNAARKQEKDRWGGPASRW